MSRATGDWLDATRLAARGAVVEREFALADFPRLADQLVGSDGGVRARLSLALVDGTPVGTLAVQARLPLRCQRCLQPLAHEVRTQSELAFVADPDAPVPGAAEAFAGDPARIDLQALVEDELLLSLPVAARHAADENCASDAAATGSGRRPFAGLQELLKN